jgi:diacylglycerol kinase (ATP)
MRSALLICNPRAGWFRRHPGSAGERQIVRALAADGIAARAVRTRGPGHAEQLAHNARRDGTELVIVWGGDGTVHEAANGLAGSPVPLAVIPGGTNNLLARELGIPVRLPQAVARLLAGKPLRIPLGQARFPQASFRTRFFVTAAGAGLDASLLAQTGPRQKRWLGPLAYWLQAGRHLFCYQFPLFRVRTAEREERVTLVIVGRTRRFAGPLILIPEANLQAATLNAALVRTRKRWRYAVLLWKLLKRKASCDDDLVHWRAPWFRCEPLEETAVGVELDGELAGYLPVEFGIVPDALTLWVPGNRNEQPGIGQAGRSWTR